MRSGKKTDHGSAPSFPTGKGRGESPLPSDFMELMRTHWGDEQAEALFEGLRQEPTVSVRFNSHKTRRLAVSPRLQTAPVAWCPDAYYLAAEIDGLVAGYAGLWRILDEGHITNVAVRPECRRQGIGARIIGTLLAQTRQLGIRHHTLEVRESNLPALALYEGFGFTSAGIRPGYYSSGHENAVIMWRHDPEIETENEDSGNNI